MKIKLTSGAINGTIFCEMSNIEKLLEHMGREPANVRFNDLKKVCRAKPYQVRQVLAAIEQLKHRP
jgi:hypothetical protein